MQSNSFIEMSVSAINCNSMNVSTIGNRNAKTYLKVEGITGKKADVILISDINLLSRIIVVALFGIF